MTHVALRHLAAALVTTTMLALTAGADTGPPVASSTAPADAFQGEHAESLDRDLRGGSRAPTAAQLAAARRAGLTVRWNRFGTPALVTSTTGTLARGLGSDPAAAARAWVARSGLFAGVRADMLETVAVTPLGPGHAVLLRQRFGGLAAGYDGLLAVGIRNGGVVFATSSLAPDADAASPPTLPAAAALAAAARDAGRPVGAGAVRATGARGPWSRYAVAGLTGEQHARLVAVPTPRDGVRPAWQVFLSDTAEGAHPLAVTSYVDAVSGEVLVRENAVDHDSDNPRWSVFPANPPLDYSTSDTRVTWCATAAPGCASDFFAGPPPWDENDATGPSFTTDGNNAFAVEKWMSNSSSTVGTNYATPSALRNYIYPWTNQWYAERCNPDAFSSPTRNDVDAASANLFAMHNSMHDFAYALGFTETTWNAQKSNFGRGGLGDDPERGNVQAGGVVGGPPNFASRDNANQITPPDGVAPTTNMYLWQPIAAAFYAPCVDGDYDMSVVGHEYTHMISNRMVAGPDQRLSGNQGNGMGESWSDLVAVEYLAAHGFDTGGPNPWAVGPYVTGDRRAGIRNYGMNASPLNYSNVGYDLVGPQVHADGEIWSAANFDVRQALNSRYDAQYPSNDATLQRACAAGTTPVTACPGNRRWVQLMFDAWLLMANGAVTMVDARDAMLAADLVRFGGANQDVLWNTFARRGLGSGATSPDGTNDPDPVPSFESPYADEAVVTFRPIGPDDAVLAGAELYVGHYEARSVPVADSDPATTVGDTVRLIPGTYELLARADGRGAQRLTVTVRAGQVRDLPVRLPVNLASAHNGAIASGDGVNLGALVDDSEATNWAYLGPGSVAGRAVTVDLAGDRPVQVRRVQVSAQLRPRIADDPGGDTGTQNRFSALRQFALYACTAGAGVDCSDASHFQLAWTSPADAFPSVAPRPRAPDLTLRSFAVPTTRATHLRLVVLSNQCTGAPAYAGEQDNDPRAVDDCAEGSAQDTLVRAAELQVFEH